MSAESDRLWSKVLAARAAAIKAQKAYHDAVTVFAAHANKAAAAAVEDQNAVAATIFGNPEQRI